ncbi:MAG: molybdopterin adenylyltransferase [Phycisphaerales bacterium]|jgi:molybdopterin adenylyltransferase|nr:molybdopterin adenylyltransferase [Phycisphaerales bacterium]MDP6312369.1 molybdopterin adenylyltransferase [Phycisphaerales bacterium]MDP7087748.1 molybdopterin adenylyltransferase [Phycisphaerales bacterium]MDP7189315.1 molybdopterin adenylyltransferase [Phycisphaerales bacterium]MDP7520298.1 molybdopterin adenylyltransferase [Phycisphaerales bacterium]|tara:strand:+ start:450 stop:983 length:534 start_codon:yes stop_codon:yes gene_type:complete
MPIAIGILTVSDRASRGEYEDRGGPAIREWLARVLCCEWTACAEIVPDESDRIEAAIIHMCDEQGCGLVLTTGGTGPSPRDVTPEATEAVCDRLMPGFGEQMRAASLQVVPTAILSRQIAGTRGSSLIINLPGKPSAVADCLDAVFPAVPYCLDLLGGPRLETRAEECEVFRPAAAL